MSIKYSAILIGGLVDLGGTALASTFFVVIFAHAVSTPDTTPSVLYEAVFEAPIFLPASFVIGIVFNTVGGYVAARLAGRNFIFYGALSAVPCILLGILTLLNPFGSPDPDWVIYLGKVSAVIFGVLGGFICKQHLTRP